MQKQFIRSLDQIRTLCGVALARLPGMLDPETGLFAFTAEGDPPVLRGTSVRYSAITALGLQRAAEHGLSCAVDLERVHRALDTARPRLTCSGDLGLVLWATARSARPVAERALRDLADFGALTRLRGGSTVHSTELAWVVLGLAEALEAGVGNERDVSQRLRGAFAELLLNRGDAGLFAFARRLDGDRWKGRVRAELGFFDAQVYGLLAALRVHELLGHPIAKDVAVTVGDRLLGHQHPLGQWAWHYNVRTGALVDLYPVYSVHQDGMAPMALLPLERLTGVPTAGAVARGVEWLFGRNELGRPLAEPHRGIVWRSIRRRAPLGAVRFPLKVASLAGAFGALDLGAGLAKPRLLEIDHEMRPYHLGFCLYAFAEICGTPARAITPKEPREASKAA